MGCADSKQSCRNARHGSPLPPNHSQPDHAVSLTSSTLGSLILEPLNQSSNLNFGNNFCTKVLHSESWSSMIEEKLSKMSRISPKSPPREPEIINMWELMADLDEQRSVDSIMTDFDTDIISEFRKSISNFTIEDTLKQNPPTNQIPTISEKPKFGIVKARISEFQEEIDAKKMKPIHTKRPPNCQHRVVLYFTSLRGIRKTYEDCCMVRIILRSFRVRLDERDLSMHYGFRKELKQILGDEYGGLPRVFANGRYLGGAEEIRRMHDSGELEKKLKGCWKAPECWPFAHCEVCGDTRFVPCENCSGSCKIFYEEDGSFYRCHDCNENGLVRCSACWF